MSRPAGDALLISEGNRHMHSLHARVFCRIRINVFPERSAGGRQLRRGKRHSLADVRRGIGRDPDFARRIFAGAFLEAQQHYVDRLALHPLVQRDEAGAVAPPTYAPLPAIARVGRCATGCAKVPIATSCRCVNGLGHPLVKDGDREIAAGWTSLIVTVDDHAMAARNV